MRKDKRYNIVVISNEPWDGLWYSKHHYANELSNRHNVHFVDPVQKKWRWSNLFSVKTGIREVNNGLKVISYCNNLPFNRGIVRKVNDYLNALKLSKIVNNNKHVVFWQFDPYRFIRIHHFKNIKRIYHVVDPFYHVKSDRKIALYSDLIIAINQAFMERYQKYNRRVIFVPHGINESELQPEAGAVEMIRKKYGKFLLLTGTVNIHTDIELLKKIAEKFDTRNLLIIGSVHLNNPEKKIQFEQLLKLKNVHFPGKVPFQQLKNYAAASEIGLIPYAVENENFARTPLKTINYLTQQKPVVSTVVTNFEELENKLVFFTRDHHEFLNYINLIFEGIIQPDSSEIDSFINRNLYSNLIDNILKHLN